MFEWFVVFLLICTSKNYGDAGGGLESRLLLIFNISDFDLSIYFSE